MHLNLVDGGRSRAELERDLYLRLLELSHRAEIEPLLREALALVVGAANASSGHVHIFGDDAVQERSHALGCSVEESRDIRKMTSRGIEAEVLGKGEIVQTPSALLDPRFSGRPSVQDQKIEAVICAPIGDGNPVGVLYLHGKAGKGSFGAEDVHLVKMFCRHLGPAIRWLTTRHTSDAADPTLPWRSRLKATSIAGRSEAVANMLEFVFVAASADIPVLLAGESGVGKTALARAIHENSRRSNARLLEVNCAAIPESLFEADLFGVKRGAFSDAREDREGKVQAAEGGTLFLDEIAELHPSSQAKLLTFLQSGAYFRVGDNEEKRANIRLIAATNVDLERAVAEGKFRKDLYFRINVFPFRVASLAERESDIPQLAQQFVEDSARRQNIASLPISPGARMALISSKWPGNLRQLQNKVESGLVRARAERSDQIDAGHLFPETRKKGEPGDPLTYQEAMRRAQRNIVEAALEAAENVTEAAERLDITRTYLYTLIKAHGLRR